MNNVVIPAILTITILVAGMLVLEVKAQMPGIPGVPSMPKEVKGKYVDSSTGVEVVFPEGWSGMEMKTDTGVTVMVMQGGMTDQQKDNMVVMMLNVMSKQPSVNTPPEMKPPTEKKVDCKLLSSKDTKVNNAPATEVVTECSGEISVKMKAYELQTEKKWVSLMYSSMPSSNYDSQVTSFEDSVKTLKVPNAIPEFPITVMAAMSVMVAAAIAISRLRNPLR